jgi:hypothetical protein
LKQKFKIIIRVLLTITIVGLGWGLKFNLNSHLVITGRVRVKSKKDNIKTKILWKGEFMSLTKWVLIIVGLIVLLMGIAGLPGVSDMGTEADWHVFLKIIVGVVAVIIPFLDKK